MRWPRAGLEPGKVNVQVGAVVELIDYYLTHLLDLNTLTGKALLPGAELNHRRNKRLHV